MSGHTHGIGLQFSPLHRKQLIHRHDYHAGMYQIENKKLYVNRGLGRLGKAIYNTRPEITVLNLC